MRTSRLFAAREMRIVARGGVHVCSIHRVFFFLEEFAETSFQFGSVDSLIRNEGLLDFVVERKDYDIIYDINIVTHRT